MTEYDTAILTQAAANAQETIDRILQSEKDPQEQFLSLLYDGWRIGKTLTLIAAGGAFGPVVIADLIKANIIYTALNQLNPSFDGWPKNPGIRFLTFARNSARELMEMFFIAVSGEINRGQPEEISFVLLSDELDCPPARLPDETLTVWATAVRGNLQERFDLNSKAWRTVETEFDSLELIFEAEYKAYFEAQKPPESQKADWKNPEVKSKVKNFIKDYLKNHKCKKSEAIREAIAHFGFSTKLERAIRREYDRRE